MTKVRKGYVDIGDGDQVHFRHACGRKGPVVFLHQTASSGQMFLKTFELLDGRWDCYAFDTPGFGGSFDPPAQTRPSLPQYADWLKVAIERAGIGLHHVVGHHTGACIAVELAARYPESIRSVSLIGPVPLTEDERTEFSRHFGIAFTPTVSGSYLLENWEYLRKLGADRDVMLLHREMTDMLRAWTGRVQSYAAVWKQDFTKLYKSLTCPLLIAASQEDVLFPYLQRAITLQPSAQVADLAGANFEPDLDASGFATALEAFLESVESV